MITFESKNIALPPLPRPQTEEWIRRVVEAHGRQVGNISYLFVDDEEILRVNRQFLAHDYYTDVITFASCDAHCVSGDIVISLDTVRSNALALSEPLERELRRVVIHGVLHLLGINDKGPGERQRMEREEEVALGRWDEVVTNY